MNRVLLPVDHTRVEARRSFRLRVRLRRHRLSIPERDELLALTCL